MESFLVNQSGVPFPDRIQKVLGELTPRFRRKFSMIRDEVVLTEILEQAGRQIVGHETEHGTVERLHGFAWVTLRNVAISRLRRGPHQMEMSAIGSAKGAALMARLTADEGSPERIERGLFLSQVLAQVSCRERQIAIWKRTGISSRRIAEKLGMTVSSVDTTYSRLKQKLQNLRGPSSVR